MPEPQLNREVGKRGRTVPLYALLAPLAALLAFVIVAGEIPDGRLHLWLLDVGQGDAMVLRTPGGRTAVIDGGPGATPLLNGVAHALPFWQREIDLVVLTHPQDDHLTGLPEMASRYRIGQVVQTTFTPTNALQHEWLRTLAERGVPTYQPARGDVIRLQGEPDFALHVLSPPEAGAAREGPTSNNASVVLRLDYGRNRLLLAGDAEARAEASMVASVPQELPSDLLKVGHHGGDTSTTPPFLSLVRPEIAVISAGEGNKYGHPAPATLAALEVAGTRVYRTDLNGTVEVIMDLERMWVKSDRDSPSPSESLP